MPSGQSKQAVKDELYCLTTAVKDMIRAAERSMPATVFADTFCRDRWDGDDWNTAMSDLYDLVLYGDEDGDEEG
jgi:hypothetical protein